MKSTIFEGIAERLEDIKREEGRGPHEQEGHGKPEKNYGVWDGKGLPPTTIPYCAVHGHNIGLHGRCVRCGLKSAQDIIDQAYRNLPSPTLDDAFEQMRKAMVARICPTYGHDIGLTGLCLNCGFKP